MLEPTFRPLITIIRLTPDRSLVEVALDLDGRLATGFADIVDDNSLLAACKGTVAAAQGLLPEHMVLTMDWAKRIERDGEPDVINSAVTLTVAGESHSENLLGAAYVRHDPEVAAVRATLDGLTRRLVGYIFD
ncbi:hypothetical protein BH23ACT9_BH23ACT9_05120 [soil metagenome]